MQCRAKSECVVGAPAAAHYRCFIRNVHLSAINASHTIRIGFDAQQHVCAQLLGTTIPSQQQQQNVTQCSPFIHEYELVQANPGWSFLILMIPKNFDQA